MRILYIHNDYAKPSGEEHAAAALAELLSEHGHEVEFFRRSSAEIADSAWGRLKSFFTGIANPCAARSLVRKLDEYRPDLAIVQNVYPLLSPSVFRPLKEHGLPVVMRCPNYRLFCPNGLCCDMQGNICEECFGGHEWHCALKSCAGGRFKSLGYAVRGWAARVSRRILDNVDVFVVQTEFQRQKFIQQGIPEDKLAILPGIMQKMESAKEWQAGKYVTFIGRCSEEKGIIEFIECARLLPDLPFRVVGAYDGMPGIREQSPANVEWLGFLKGEALRQAYLDSRMIVVPSRCYEGFPNVIVQAMQMERPVVAVNLGSSGSIVLEGVTGDKFTPMDVHEMAGKISSLYADLERCRQYGEAGHQEATALYSREQIYAKLKAIIDAACRRAHPDTP